MVLWQDILTTDFGFFGHFIVFFSILSVTAILARIIQGAIHRYMRKSSALIKARHTEYAFIKHVATALIWLVGISGALLSIPSLRSLSLSLFAGAGILAATIGLASQQVFSNMMSGVFIAIFKPFRVDDWVKIDAETYGVVEDINLHHIVVRTPENKRVVIPNSVISSVKLENAHLVDEKVCKIIDISISYDSDVDKAMKIITEECMKHPSCLDNRTEEEKTKKNPVVDVRMIAHNDSSIDLRAWAWAPDQMSAFYMKCDLLKSIKKRFDKTGIEIPFPHRTVYLRKDRKGYKPKP